MNTKELLNANRSLHLKDVVSKDLCEFLTHILVRKSFESHQRDDQVPDCLATAYYHPAFETLLEKLWPMMELATGRRLVPTYSFARLYKNGNFLEKHTDREECEISITIQLGRSHHYAWPIYMEGTRYDLAEGDGVVYFGYEAEHWRDACDGPPGYYSGQVFLHYVDADGPNAHRACDVKKRSIYKYMFVKNRVENMELK